MEEFYRFDNVYFRRGGFLVTGDSLIVGGTMGIDEYGKLTHYDATLDYETLLDLTVRTLEITSTGSIDVDGRGYVGSQGPAMPVEDGRLGMPMDRPTDPAATTEGWEEVTPAGRRTRFTAALRIRRIWDQEGPAAGIIIMPVETVAVG